MNGKVRYISLGSSCYVADVLKEKGLKGETLPFDWCVTTLKYIAKHIASGFSLPLEFDRIVQGAEHGYAYGDGWLSVHDFDSLSLQKIGSVSDTESFHKQWESLIPEVKSKYQRRLQRLNNYCEEKTGKVVFLRHKIEHPYFAGTPDTASDCLELVKLLEQSYPNLDFELMYIGPEEKGMKMEDLPTHPRLRYHLQDGLHGLVHCRTALEWYLTLINSPQKEQT